VHVNASDLSYEIYDPKGGEIHCIVQDKLGNIWLGCTMGLLLLNDKKTFDAYTMSNGLPNDNISCMCNGNKDNFWICTAEGISNFNIAAKTFTNYFSDDGLAANSDYNCITANSKGEIIIGGNNFITVFDPAVLTTNKIPPPVYVTSIRILNRDGTDTVLNYPHDTLQLSYNQNYFNVSFTALNLINAGANRYAYRLEGLDKNWIYTKVRSAANYSNLSPGAYTFKIKASNNNGVWNNKGASLTVIIAPPFWDTWWFIAVCAILVFAAIYAIYRYRLNQALQLERLRSRISTDLHDDIGSTLSSISILSDMAIHAGGAGHSNEMLHEIKENSVGLMEKMDDIVWSINPKNDSLENLLLRIKRFAAQLFEAKNIEYEINISEDLQSFKIPMEIRQHLYLMIKEAINNIIKHSQCTSALINIEQLNDHLIIIITDDGKGFNMQGTAYGNGIINLKERAKIIHAALSITSGLPVKGTQIKIELKIK
jgi:signal transduction histidine kinase